MEATLTTLEDNKVQAAVTVDKRTVESALNKKYKELARQYNFPGFRKGKAPRPVIDNALGREYVLASITEEIVNNTYPEVIEEKRIFPVASPDFGDMGMIEPGNDFSFEFTVSVKPEIELTSYDPVEIEIPAETASEREIDEQIDAILEHYKTFENASAATKLKEGESADVDIKAMDEDGNEIESQTRMAAVYAPGSGLYSEAFDAEMLGIKKGETKTFTLDLPEDESALLLSDLAGKKVTFEVLCNSVLKNVTPKLTDEWVKETLDFENVADLREQVKESITTQKKAVIPRIKENACASKLVERVSGDVPESMIEKAESELLQDFFTQLQRQGMNFDTYLMQQGIDSNQFKQDVKRQAEDEAKQQLALDAWARHNNIDATDEDVTEQFVIAGIDDPKRVQREWRESGRLYLIREGVIRSKAMENVMETAKVTEKDQ